MFYVYVLKSKNDNKKYVGYTKNLKFRLEQHSKSLVIKKRKISKNNKLFIRDAQVLLNRVKN